MNKVKKKKKKERRSLYSEGWKVGFETGRQNATSILVMRLKEFIISNQYHLL